MRDYELTYIIKPDLDAATVTTLIERVTGFVTAEGGVVVKTNHWGLRQLAYPIRKFRDGNYVFTVVQIEAPALARIEQRLRMIEDVLRYLLVRAEDAGEEPAADVMGGEATGEAAPAAEAEAETSPEPSAEASADTPAAGEPAPATA